MFTLKWIDDEGNDHYMEVTHVETLHLANPNPLTNDDKTRIAVNGWTSFGDSILLDSGTIYVMNSSGKTVGNYCLSKPTQAAGNTK